MEYKKTNNTSMCQTQSQLFSIEIFEILAQNTQQIRKKIMHLLINRQSEKRKENGLVMIFFLPHLK